MYSKRVAYVDHGRNIFSFGGKNSYIHSLLECCEALGWRLDICTDMPISRRMRRMPKEVFDALKDYTFHPNILGKHNYSRTVAVPIMEAACAANTLLEEGKRKVYDLIIFGAAPCAYAALTSGLVHPNCYIYLHRHEVFNDMPFKTTVPQWLVDIFRSIVMHLPVAGILTQHATNISKIVQFTGVSSERIHVVPITTPGYHVDHCRKGRKGIAFLGSGEAVKNPMLAIQIFNQLENIPISFYVGRGAPRLRKLLEREAQFEYTVYEKLSRSALREELREKICGVHSAWVEGYGISIAEQMHYYPVVVWDRDYSNCFPSALKFTSVTDAVNIVNSLVQDARIWNDTCGRNAEWLKSSAVSNVIPLYTALMKRNPLKTDTVNKVNLLLSSISSCTYEDILKHLGWSDHVVAMGSSPRWSIGRLEEKYHTYLYANANERPSLSTVLPGHLF